MSRCRIGCSGFMYDGWKGVFYPGELPQKKWLSFYVNKFDTVELNITFHRLPKKEAFERWYKETPQDFSFSLKGSRFITHVKKLKDVELPLSTFFNTTAPLMEKFDIVLWQLPPNIKANLKVLKDFIEALRPYPYRYAFEFRHKSWINNKVIKLLSASNIALCMADWPDFINELPLTADFVYIRRHGKDGNHSASYAIEQLKKDAKRIKSYLKEGRDVYIYFNNDTQGYAPQNAMELKTFFEKPLPKSHAKKKPAPKPKKVKPEKAKPKKKIKPKKIKPVQKLRRKTKQKPVKPKKKKPAKKSR